MEQFHNTLKHADVYYRGADGEPGQIGHLKIVARGTRAVYGSSPAAEFGPLALKAVRQRMVEKLKRAPSGRQIAVRCRQRRHRHYHGRTPALDRQYQVGRNPATGR